MHERATPFVISVFFLLLDVYGCYYMTGCGKATAATDS